MNKQDQSTVIPRQYLWAVGIDTEAFPQGSMLGDRYRVIDSQIVVDTQSFKLPEIPDEFPNDVVSYLRLSRLVMHLPRPYGLLRFGEELGVSEVLLLEDAPIDSTGKLLPTLEASWGQATPLRQVNWLWQVLQLWQPLAEQNMTKTLLNANFLRVDGAWLRLLELQADDTPVTLTQLGDLWVHWLDRAKPEIAEPIAEFFYDLGRGDHNITSAIAFLDQLSAQVSQTLPLTVRIASATDKGQRRDHNEDTCYPDPKRQKRSQQNGMLRDRVAIICDGLGGHEGGEVASSMAIKTLEQQLQILLRQVETDSEPFSADGFIAQLEAIVRVVNNQIVALNDQQKRQAQQRMGTTLVMAVIPAPQGKPHHEVYIVHVGDSRIYWIDSKNCRQVSLDDDVATRESILGYNFYSYATQRIDGGALIQALGTRTSDMLLPRVQRFIIDEDCLLLLCSDGLSDFDRVNMLQESHIRPILTQDKPLDRSCQELIKEGNHLNGHDNITLALMRCRLAKPNPEEDRKEEEELATVLQTVPLESNRDVTIAEVRTKAKPINPTSALVTSAQKVSNTEVSEDINTEKTELGEVVAKQTSRGFLILLVCVMFLLGSGLAATQVPSVRKWLERQIPKEYIPPKMF
ncbi:protein phosphatase 2C domain-containing protein [Tumidithrix elongata RA019]|uniref:Protein phosphatase 2C domain-containing protein n=1 Tax=Tumidithrix elongata BACA0141 TaxID=2716417 RepID=A0AAW9Q3X7_9CYAN|nr:protein phosphatase 2C domain-containing protein [Tumidithrix elongata RA019]